MIYQINITVPAALHFWGCYLLALCERIGTHFDMPFTMDSVLDLLSFGQTHKFIDEEITILDPQALCDHVLGQDKLRFEGKFERTYQTLDDELEIVCYHKDGASFNHFCSGNGRGMVVYDPYSAEGSDSVKNGNLIGKRIYRIL